MKRGAILLGVLATILTAKLGTIEYQGHKETWYNLKMNKVVERADAYYGLSDVYGVTEDGIKTYNGFVIVAADMNKRDSPPDAREIVDVLYMLRIAASSREKKVIDYLIDREEKE